MNDKDVWLYCFDSKVGEKLQIYCGDSEGSMYIFEHAESQALESREVKDTLFRLKLKQEKLHKNGIIQILLVPKENLIFTISFDQTLRWFEATERAPQVTLQNPNKAIYTSICWDN